MDLYPKNPATLRKLLAKRQNPCTQIFKSQQLSNTTNQPKTAVNFSEKSIPNSQNNKPCPNTTYATSESKTSPKISFQKQSTPRFSPNIQKAVPKHTQNAEDDSDSFEKIDKKVKTTTTVEPNSRRTSFDDEKYETDHSTTCDARSEGNATNETTDFFWSPLLSSEPTKDPVILTLDGEEDPSKSEGLLYIDSPTEDVSTFMKAQHQAEKLGGVCLSRNCSPNGKFKFRCQLRHQWEMTVDELERRWCSKCEAILRKCKAFAMENNGKCLNERLEDTISFSCCQGHQWNASYKNFSSKWCNACAEEEKDNLRKKCEEHRRKREKEEEEQQKRLFEEARKKFMENICNQGMSEEDILSYFQKVDAEVEGLAKEATAKFMSEQETCQNISYQQALQVAKIMLMPEHILQNYMSSLSPEILRSEYRRLAKIIHPDKNRHPDAGDAFKKIHKVYEVVVGKLERS